MFNKSESKVREDCIKRLKKDGWMVWSLSDKWVSGYPDVICFKPNGKVKLVEFKRPSGGVRSNLQIYYINKLKGMGFNASFVKDVKELYEKGEEK